MPRTSFTAAVCTDFSKREGFVPLVLLDIQLRDGTTYYLSDFPGVFPVKIGSGPTAVYSPWVKAAGPFTLSKGLATDAGDIILQNLTGNTIDRDVAAAMAAREFEGALCVVRFWHELLQLTLMELHGTLGDQHDHGDEASFRYQQLFDTNSVDLPIDTYSTQCVWKFKESRCGSTGAAAVCDKTFATCADGNHNAIERFTGVPLIPPALEYYKREEVPERRGRTRSWKMGDLESQITTFSTRNNPALSGPRVIAYGKVRAAGIIAMTQIRVGSTTSASQYTIHLLGEGEWDGIDHLWIATRAQDVTDTTVVRFHAGADGTLGGGLAATSTGPDQGVDSLWASMPGGAQKLTFSRIAYIMVAAGVTGQDLTASVDILGDYRARKCRVFDASGTQTAFSFQTTPTWQLIDLVVRFMLKTGAMSGEALTAAEKSRINFADAVTHAADCDFNIGGGIKRFEGHLAISQNVKLSDVLTQLLQMCRSYILEIDGALSIRMDKARASTFTLTADHLDGRVEKVANSKRKAVNRYVGKFRDLNGSRIDTVVSCVRNAAGLVTVTVSHEHFASLGDRYYLSGVAVGANDFNVDFVVSAVTSTSILKFNQAGANETQLGGTLAKNESRFMEDSCIGDHEEHQALASQRGVGLSPAGTVIPTDLDYGNNTYERVSRLVKYKLLRELGVGLVNGDLAGAAYKLPREVNLKAWMHAVDAAGNALMAQLPGDLITIDKSCSEEWAGTYEIIKIVLPRIAAGETANTTIALDLMEYVPSAFTDVANTAPTKYAAQTAPVKPAGGIDTT